MKTTWQEMGEEICPMFGNPLDCYGGVLCPDHQECAKSAKDSEENYCYKCNRVKHACICKK